MGRIATLLVAVAVLIAVVITVASSTDASQADASHPPAFPEVCGKYRWPVKTLTDKAARDVKLIPRHTSVGKLRSLGLHPRSLTSTTPRKLVERKTRTIDVDLVAMKLEEDQDIHLVVAGRGSGNMMIVEFPATKCTKRAGRPVYKPGARGRMSKARRALIDACGRPSEAGFVELNGKATVTGVVFSDFEHENHEQRGVAPNGVELHPVTRFSSQGCQRH